MSGLGERIREYGAWRAELSGAIGRYGRWLEEAGLSDAPQRARLAGLLERLRDDRMAVVVVAEFSRGKSELINALFFADLGQRVVPSGAGRTTMCPTELAWDPDQPAGIRLLPIETRLREATVSELRRAPHEWRTLPFDPSDVASLRRAFESVRETKRVPIEEAILMDLHDEDGDGPGGPPDEDDTVEVPCWRHALVNLPHPLLETGLVVIDTPGLNALGVEPELTLSLIPSAHAVLFVLAADAGVTRSDAQVWNEHVSPTHRAGRFVVLNKIDGLWDGLREPVEIEREIDAQVASVARTLQLPAQRVFPVSAQKGLVGKVARDATLLARSRLPELEGALSRELVPQQRAIVRDAARREFDEAHGLTWAVLSARRRNLVEQVLELEGLRGRNREALERTARRLRAERSDLESALRRAKALRAVFARQREAIAATVSIERLRDHVRTARHRMRGSRLSLGLRDGMAGLLAAARGDFARLGAQVGEVEALMAVMYAAFEREHGMEVGRPASLDLTPFGIELDRIDALHERRFGTMSLVTTEKWALTRRFFESVAVRLREVYERAGRDIDAWSATLVAPVEAQVRERQARLFHRVGSVRRATDASGQLEVRIAELCRARDRVDARIEALAALAREVSAVLERRDATAGEPATLA